MHDIRSLAAKYALAPEPERRAAVARLAHGLARQAEEYAEQYRVLAKLLDLEPSLVDQAMAAGRARARTGGRAS